MPSDLHEIISQSSQALQQSSPENTGELTASCCYMLRWVCPAPSCQLRPPAAWPWGHCVTSLCSGDLVSGKGIKLLCTCIALMCRPPKTRSSSRHSVCVTRCHHHRAGQTRWPKKEPSYPSFAFHLNNSPSVSDAVDTDGLALVLLFPETGVY